MNKTCGEVCKAGGGRFVPISLTMREFRPQPNIVELVSAPEEGRGGVLLRGRRSLMVKESGKGALNKSQH